MNEHFPRFGKELVLKFRTTSTPIGRIWSNQWYEMGEMNKAGDDDDDYYTVIIIIVMIYYDDDDDYYYYDIFWLS